MTWVLLPLAVVPFPPKLPLLCPLSVDVWSTKHWKKLLSSVKRSTRSKDVCSATTFLLAWPALTASSLSCSAFLCSSSLIFCYWTCFSLHLFSTNPPWCAAAAAPPRTASPSRNAGSPSPATPWTSLEEIQLGAKSTVSHRITSRGCCLPLSAS